MLSTQNNSDSNPEEFIIQEIVARILRAKGKPWRPDIVYDHINDRSLRRLCYRHISRIVEGVIQFTDHYSSTIENEMGQLLPEMNNILSRNDIVSVQELLLPSVGRMFEPGRCPPEFSTIMFIGLVAEFCPYLKEMNSYDTLVRNAALMIQSVMRYKLEHSLPKSLDRLGKYILDSCR